MKFAIGLLLLMNAEVSISASEPDYNACAQIYVGVSDAGGKLEAREAREFLNAISCDYFSTAEGVQFGMELIVVVLENSPDEFISAFDQLSPALQGQILEAIESPIHDGFDLINIYSRVANSKAASPAKSRILAAVRTAAEGKGLDLNERSRTR